MSIPLITLLTDFGTADGYVGEVKGALLTAVPRASIVDVTHDVMPQDVEGGRLALARYWRRFPENTVHLVIVDPGVGTPRAALAIAAAGRFVVGPDNGVLSPALLASDARAYALPVSGHAAPTFHGRDVFAPVAAALAVGRPIETLGEPIADPVIRRTPEPTRWPDGTLRGEVIAIDRFGNAITNLVALRDGMVIVGESVLPLVRTYGEVQRGGLVSVCGSSGLIEIAQRNGSAADVLRLSRGDVVLFKPSANR